MRVLAASWGVSDHRGGGEAIGAYQLVRHLAESGLDVDLVTPEFDVKDPLPGNVRVHAVKRGPRWGNTGANKAATLKEMRRLRRRVAYDVEHVVSQFTSWPIEGRPFVMSGCWVFPPKSTGSPSPTTLQRLRRDLSTGSVAERVDVARDVLFAVRNERLRGWSRSRTLAEADLVIVRQGLGVEALAPVTRRVAHVPFGIDIEHFPFSDAPREPVVLYAGNLRPYKNVDGLLRAFARVAEAHPDARLEIAGEGPERAALEALAKSLDLTERVAFLGHVPRHELPTRFQRAAVFALPSHAESFGLVCLEAMAAGTPVVASRRISGAHDFMEDGANGFFVDPADEPGLAEALDRVLADTALGRRLGARARKTAERFTWESVARQHRALYETL